MSSPWPMCGAPSPDSPPWPSLAGLQAQHDAVVAELAERLLDLRAGLEWVAGHSSEPETVARARAALGDDETATPKETP